MASLVWLLIPVMAVCIAGLWSSWATRRRMNGGGDAAGVAGYDAFRSAMERPREAWAAEPAPEADSAPRAEDEPQPDCDDRPPARNRRRNRSGVELNSPVEHVDRRSPATTRKDRRSRLEAVREPVVSAAATDSPSRTAD
ncbi:hypothetical protein MTQ01_15265 [Streptomyces sp. XM4193]|uniref:hypothetical protein n=1 Tax=Streptomyces sp. XM4193 TaxID=2929782 RepID=UPI001FF99F1E|nr:hypothetical protein [Streptomyces sp. XM4193]MCK1797357.1 hypothetical protein [Streptomyces sp. XM4193]